MWPPVYPGINSINDDTMTRVQARIPRADAGLIISMVGNTAILSHLIQTELKHVADYIRTNKLTYADSESFLIWLRERSTSHTSCSETPSPNDSGRSKSGHKPTPVAENKRTKSGKSHA